MCFANVNVHENAHAHTNAHANAHALDEKCRRLCCSCRPQSIPTPTHRSSRAPSANRTLALHSLKFWFTSPPMLSAREEQLQFRNRPAPLPSRRPTWHCLDVSRTLCSRNEMVSRKQEILSNCKNPTRIATIPTFGNLFYEMFRFVRPQKIASTFRKTLGLIRPSLLRNVLFREQKKSKSRKRTNALREHLWAASSECTCSAQGVQVSGLAVEVEWFWRRWCAYAWRKHPASRQAVIMDG